MKYIFSPLLLFLPILLPAQQFDVSHIPDSLKKNAYVVIRYEERTLEIKSPGKAVEHERHVYSILDEKGNDFGAYKSGYDKFHSINYISGKLYDPAGKTIKHVKKKDMRDVSPGSDESLMTDTRYIINDFYNRTYPYTVDYEEEDDIDGILYFPFWAPLGQPNVAAEYSKYVIIAPKDYLVRYKAFNCNIQPVITENGGKKIYTWEIRNLPAITMENMAPPFREIIPFILFAPSDFEAEGYKGNMSTWENYGKFIYALTKGRDVLPEDIRKKVHELTDRIKDDRQKVYVLYDFLQKNTRYISIQLGIGGWQPFPAEYVATRRYGDCKALSNYMIALLKEAGLHGKYVEIWARRDAPELVDEFPSMQGNHVICCVPLAKDTIWLECTSQTESPGYMGSFTGGRKAILIDETGGHIVNTPVYSSADNLQSRTVTAAIDETGTMDADLNTRYVALRQETPHDLIHEVSAEQREKYLNTMFDLPTYIADKQHYEEQKGPLPEIKEYLHIHAPNCASITGKRLFISPNLFNKSHVRFAADSARLYDIVNREAFKDIDSITLKIPAGYNIESAPQDVKIESRFGRYMSSVKIVDDKIVYYRLEEQYSGKFPSGNYQELVKYYEQIYKADRNRVVLIKKS